MDDASGQRLRQLIPRCPTLRAVVVMGKEPAAVGPESSPRVVALEELTGPLTASPHRLAPDDDAAYPLCVKYTGCPPNAPVVWCSVTGAGHQGLSYQNVNYYPSTGTGSLQWNFLTKLTP